MPTRLPLASDTAGNVATAGPHPFGPTSTLPPRARTATPSIFWRTGARAALDLLVLGILARLLSPADFGIIGVALLVTALASLAAEAGPGSTLLDRASLTATPVRAAVRTALLRGALLGATVGLAAPVIAAAFRMQSLEPVLRALAWSVPLLALNGVLETLLRRAQRFRQIAIGDLVRVSVGYGLVATTLALLGWGVWALVIAHLVQTALHTVLLVAARPVPLPGLLPPNSLQAPSGGPMAPCTAYLARHADQLIVGAWLGPLALGLYGRACQLVAVPAALVADVVDTVLAPAMSKPEGESRRLASAYRRGVSLIAVVTLPSSVALSLLAPDLVHVALGARWSDATEPFRLLVLGAVFLAGSRLSATLARASGHATRTAWRHALCAGLVTAGAWIGQHWGLESTAMALLAAMGVNFVLMAQLALRIAGLSWASFIGAHVPGLLLAATLYLVVGGAAPLMVAWQVPSVARLAVMVFLAAGILVMLARRFPRLVLGRDGVWMIRQLQLYFPALSRLRIVPQFS